MNRFENRVALVTGGASGIGAASVRRLVTEGAQVMIADLDGQGAEQLASEIGAMTDTFEVDVADSSAVDDMVKATVERFGRLDVLFNNAGMGSPSRTIDETPIEDWLKVVDVNLTGSFLCARAAFALMRRQDPHGGRIINNGSISAYVPRAGSAPYTATKHAITGLTRSLSLDGRPFNIACGQVDIGNAATPMTDRMATGVPQADGSIRIEPRMDVENVATTVLYMAELPLEANVQFVTVMATTMPFIGRG